MTTRLARARAMVAEMRAGVPPPARVVLSAFGIVGASLPAERGPRIWDLDVAAALADKASAPVSITINTSGGSTSEAFSIFERLRSHRGVVTARVLGACHSAGTAILLGADVRTATPGSKFLLHASAFDDPSINRWTADALRHHADLAAGVDEKLVAIYAERTGWAKDWFKRAIKTESLIGAETALRIGLIHEIASPRKSKPHTPAPGMYARRGAISGSSSYSAKASGSHGEMMLYGPIGDYLGGISPLAVAGDLKALGNVKTLDVRISSDGGDVWQGRTIYSLLQQHPAKIVVHVDGLAASIASLIAMAGDEIRMADGSFMMIHKASALAYGNDDELRDTIELLKVIDTTLVDTYVARTGQTKEKVKAMLGAETWLTADQAKSLGFADTVVGHARTAARVRADAGYRRIPTSLRPQ